MTTASKGSTRTRTARPARRETLHGSDSSPPAPVQNVQPIDVVTLKSFWFASAGGLVS